MATDLLGNELSDSEARILAVYAELKELCAEDLSPVAQANLREALSALYNVVNGLGLQYEHLVDIGL
jgi:hypothetical protein